MEYFLNKPIYQHILKLLEEKADAIVSSASGSIAHFEDGAEADAVSVIAHLEPVQDLHEYDSPWPAGGGKNKFTTDGETKGRFIAADNATPEFSGWNYSDYISVLSNTQYTFNPNSEIGSSAKAWYYDSNKEPISYISSGQQTFTTPDNCVFMRFSYRDTSTNIQLELGSTATAYEPYSNICPITGHTEMDVVVSPTTDSQDGTTYPITFPTEAGTVYGGYVDVTNGKLVVDMARVDVGTLKFLSANPALETGFAGRMSIPNRLSGTNFTEVYCDSYAFWGNGITSQISRNIQNGQFACQSTNDFAWFRNDSCSTLEELKNALSGVYLVYKTAEPIHYQLTPQEITTLLGINNIWNDCNGDTDVTYRADTKLYIDNRG